MGKNNKKKKVPPFVSVCTPTFNRRPFIPIMFQCFLNQTYPKDRLEWIIVDDGTDKIEDLIKEANIPQIQYFKIDQKMTLGAKRNFTHSKTKGSILVYMDDDDYYPPERISHAVEKLQSDPQALCAGSSEIYVFFKHIWTMYKGGPYGPKHATAGTFAFKRELLNQTKYNETACLAEEREFLKEYTIPFVQLDPLKTILVFSHIQNTFDKKRLLENPNPKFVKCDRKIEEFIKHDYEAPVKDYFVQKIDAALECYKPGDPSMKPDVLKQTKELEIKREKMQKEMAAQGQGQIILQRPGEEPKALTNQEIAKLLENQKKEIENRGQKIAALMQQIQAQQEGKPIYEELDKRGKQIQVLENIVKKLKEELQDTREQIQTLQSESKAKEVIEIPMTPTLPPVPPVSEPVPVSKITPEITVNVIAD